MELEKISEGDYCSDDDIFLSPCKKRIEKRSKCKSKILSPIKGIFDEKVRKMKSCLAGIPRPPIEPICVNFKMEDVELFLHSVKSAFEGNERSKENVDNNIVGRKLGTYLNLDHSCEELERLGSLYVEKYLLCETSSTMNDHSTFTQLTASAKKRRRCNGWATSPGSRLSYLARRKSTFSVDHVAKLSQPASTKQFLLQRDKIIKGAKSVPLKPKRALFQSPEEKKNNPFKTPDSNERRRSLRNRMSVPDQNISRSTPQSRDQRKLRSCRKSLEFSQKSEKIDSSVLESKSSSREQKSSKTESNSSEHVKRKLLWAVSNALKSISVTSTHAKFKICMNKLFKSTSNVWNTKYTGKKTHPESSTSENMLSVAKSLLKEVLPELERSKKKTLTDESACSEYSLSRSKDDSNSSLLTDGCDPICNGSQLKLPSSSENSIISLNITTQETMTPVTHLNSEVISTENTLTTPLRATRSNTPRSCNTKKKEFRSSNHKRKRDSDEDDELLNGITSLDFQISKSRKLCSFAN